MENTIEKQIELLRLCNQKEMNFELSYKHGMIQVMEFDNNSEFLFNEMIYIDNKNALKILNELIEKVKNYK